MTQVLIQPQNLKYYDLLFLSPHLDDVVISCAGKLLGELGAGCTALVATVFSSGETSERNRLYYEGRRREDGAALDILGADYTFLDLPDAPIRNSFYRTYRQLYVGEHPSDREFGMEVARKVVALWQMVRPMATFFPLAVGNHIDHRLTYQCHFELPSDAEIVFYEDRPYSFVKHSVKLRLRQIGSISDATTAGADHLPAPPITLYWEFLKDMRSIHYYRRHLRNRWFAPLMLISFFNLPPAGRRHGTPLNLEPEIVVPADRLIGKIAAAVSSYKSQSAALFGSSVKTWFKEVEEYGKKIGRTESYVERYWRLRR